MSIKESRYCDVYGKVGADAYRVTIEKVAPGELTAPRHVFDANADLSKRGFERLIHFIQRGLRKPNATPTETT